MLSDAVYEILQLSGILAFAISGALVGVRRRLDILGVVVVGSFTGVGGGIVRDMLLGVHPPVSFTHWPNLAVAVAGSLAVFFIHPGITRIRHFEVVFDAFGLGLFSANGAATALAAGQTPLTAILVGTITAIGGGVIRDVLVNTVPGVLTRELYAVSALLGAGIAVAIMALGGGNGLASLVGGAGAILLRLTSVARGWHLPKPRIGRERSPGDSQEAPGEG
ncbi:trimeric intracellular cation channel family protein [Leucobacter tenebrionis]|uniref:trimeric intracellular cation channel family protein n=1 Tax=Leucobacter tenebrionis TaxID=2873270 RepID=UPI001CA76DF2|nr:trimeric intracellular cation channel family protein [Leucobacter tenebrionis]QZY51554.1 trimeric intracellular cation channel family protein [Leucobacter tenebrionis]